LKKELKDEDQFAWEQPANGVDGQALQPPGPRGIRAK
jgi:hypothetical protein